MPSAPRYVPPYDCPDYLPALPDTEQKQQSVRLLPRQRAVLVLAQMQAKCCGGPCQGGDGDCFLSKIGQPGYPSASVIGRISRSSRTTVSSMVHEQLPKCRAAEDAAITAGKAMDQVRRMQK